jgi:hypothetical protein
MLNDVRLSKEIGVKLILRRFLVAKLVGLFGAMFRRSCLLRSFVPSLGGVYVTELLLAGCSACM